MARYAFVCSLSSFFLEWIFRFLVYDSALIMVWISYIMLVLLFWFEFQWLCSSCLFEFNGLIFVMLHFFFNHVFIEFGTWFLNLLCLSVCAIEMLKFDVGYGFWENLCIQAVLFWWNNLSCLWVVGFTICEEFLDYHGLEKLFSPLGESRHVSTNPIIKCHMS